MKFLLSFIVVALLVLAGPAHAQQSGPQVVTSIKPVHSLVSAVMKGVGEPHLIVRGFSSPHAYSMKPSDAQALQRAKLVFWIGPQLESFLRAPLAALSHAPNTIALANIAGVEKRRRLGRDRHQSKEHAEHIDHTKHDEHEGHSHAAGQYDMHIWLDPQNAIAIVKAVQVALSASDPHHSEAYEANAEETISKLQQLIPAVRKDLADARGRPFVVFHDAYSYFEHRFDLHAAAAIAVHPETPPGAKRLTEIRKEIRELGVICVYAEPQFSPKLVALLIDGTKAKAAELDPLGARLSAGPNHYFDLIRQLTASFKTCLTP